MPYTNPRSRLMNPLCITSWASIKTIGKGLMRNCLYAKGGSIGGEAFVGDSMHFLTPGRTRHRLVQLLIAVAHQARLKVPS